MSDVQFLNNGQKSQMSNPKSIFSLQGSKNKIDPIFFKMVSKCTSCVTFTKKNSLLYLIMSCFLITGQRSHYTPHTIGFECLWCLVTIVNMTVLFFGSIRSIINFWPIGICPDSFLPIKYNLKIYIALGQTVLFLVPYDWWNIDLTRYEQLKFEI